MGHFSKWNSREAGKLRVCLFRSRNKDNKGVEGFQERSKSFLTRKSPEQLENEFLAFVNDGVSGEMCRLYMSVNARDGAKVRKALMKYLVDNDDADMAYLPSLSAKVAALVENKAEKNWLFDYDDDLERVDEFVELLKKVAAEDVGKPEMTVTKYRTPNGYAVVTDRGTDVRKLVDSEFEFELKRDASVCHNWKTKE